MKLVYFFWLSFSIFPEVLSVTCNATLWKELVDPLIQIYSDSVLGLPYILKGLELELTYLESQNLSFTTEKRIDVLKSSSADLCDLDIDAEQNLQFVCESANDTRDPDLGTCTCSKVWQHNVISLYDPTTKLVKCYAIPGVSKCRRLPSFLRHFRSWLECYPGADCVEDPLERRLQIGGATEYEFAYGFCKCRSPKEVDCKELQHEYAPEINGKGQTADQKFILISIILFVIFSF